VFLPSGQAGAEAVAVLSAGADQAHLARQEVVDFLISPPCADQAEVVFLPVSAPADQVIVITGQVIGWAMADRIMATDLVSEGLITDHIIVITVFTGRF